MLLHTGISSLYMYRLPLGISDLKPVQVALILTDSSINEAVLDRISVFCSDFSAG